MPILLSYQDLMRCDDQNRKPHTLTVCEPNNAVHLIHINTASNLFITAGSPVLPQDRWHSMKSQWPTSSWNAVLLRWGRSQYCDFSQHVIWRG